MYACAVALLISINIIVRISFTALTAIINITRDQTKSQFDNIYIFNATRQRLKNDIKGKQLGFFRVA